MFIIVGFLYDKAQALHQMFFSKALTFIPSLFFLYCVIMKEHKKVLADGRQIKW